MDKPAVIHATDVNNPKWLSPSPKRANSVTDLCRYFSVTVDELMAFWDTLIWPEKQDFLWADLGV